MTPPEASDARVEEVSIAWLRYNKSKNDDDFWATELVDEWIYREQIESAWRVIIDLCARVDLDDLAMIANVGAGPLEDFVVEFSDRAMDLIEPELDSNPTLLKALAMVWRWDAPIRPRVDRVLAEHGQERL